MTELFEEERLARALAVVDLMTQVDTLAAAVERASELLAMPRPDRGGVLAAVDEMRQASGAVGAAFARTEALVLATLGRREVE